MRVTAIRILPLTMALALLAGCASAPQGLGSLTSPAPQEPYYKEYRETITPGFTKTYNVSVAPGALLLLATLTLQTQTHGFPAPGAVPAMASLTIGEATATADPLQPNATLELAHPLAGKHRIIVNATGPSGNVDGAGEYGATYLLVVQVKY